MSQLWLGAIALLLAAAALLAWWRERRAARGTQRNIVALGEPLPDDGFAQGGDGADQAATLRRLMQHSRRKTTPRERARA